MTPKKAAEVWEIKTKLKRARIGKGLTQAELSEKSGVPLCCIPHYESGRRDIDGAKLETLCNLCLVLGCKIEDIIENPETIEKLRIMQKNN